MPLAPFLHRVAAGADLTSEEAHAAMTLLLEGGRGDAVVGAFLVALHVKGETATELAGFARALREHMVVVDAGADVIDIVGTGGDGAGTFNISTVAAMVLAGAGARVAKHGNRAISGKVGSADVLEALGVRIAMTPEDAAWAVREIGLGFLFAPHLHPAMKNVQGVRRELKMRTVFNLLGPLANPARAQTQVIGAPSAEFALVMAQALAELGTGHSYVVHGGGLDEVSTAGSTDVYEVWSGRVEKSVWMPEDFGVPRASLDELAGGDAADNARIAREILGGMKGPRRNIVVVNAAVGLLASGLASTLREAVAKASEAIDSGRALGILQQLQKRFGKE
ncbi:MAG TPA: anthranilate phosphoribosyltransferase [Bryobacteraceae bacterium]|nr:anthranilate phosphoribosyltransferase [Bryobacteraceae bacterium]